MLIIGIDDAGRGPLIGPMIMAGVLIEKKDEEKLKKHNVRDSKLVPHPLRIKLAELIKGVAIKYHIVKVYPSEIDFSITNRVNLNTLEAKKAAEIINALNSKDKTNVIIDCPSVNTKAWKNVLLKYIDESNNLDIKCEHKADVNHVSVSAASILAKVSREEEIKKLKLQYGNFGSGYPGDPLTKEFLKNKGKEFKNTGLFRKSWQTWKALFPQKEQATLERF